MNGQYIITDNWVICKVCFKWSIHASIYILVFGLPCLDTLKVLILNWWYYMDYVCYPLVHKFSVNIVTCFGLSVASFVSQIKHCCNPCVAIFFWHKEVISAASHCCFINVWVMSYHCCLSSIWNNIPLILWLCESPLSSSLVAHEISHNSVWLSICFIQNLFTMFQAKCWLAVEKGLSANVLLTRIFSLVALLNVWIKGCHKCKSTAMFMNFCAVIFI